MKVQIMSDLHLEFGPFEMPYVERDVLILAGDIHIGKGATEFIKEQTELSPVIYVLGNHEFYYYEYHELLKYWKDLRLPNLYFLENSRIEINDYTFLGATLWTDFNHRNPDSMNIARNLMSDFELIRFQSTAIQPEYIATVFEESVRYFEMEMQQIEKIKGSNKKTIVVTHHLPTEQSIGAQFADVPLNCAFYSDLDSLILKYQPKAWIHGHTHISFDYMIENTRIICNPRGYIADEKNPRFKPWFIVEF